MVPTPVQQCSEPLRICSSLWLIYGGICRSCVRGPEIPLKRREQSLPNKLRMSYYGQQQPPVGVPPPQGYPPEGYPKDAYPPAGYPPQGYPQGYPPQGYPAQGYPQGYGQPPPQYVQQAPPQSSGPSFMEGCLAALCCCCLLDACF